MSTKRTHTHIHIHVYVKTYIDKVYMQTCVLYDHTCTV